MKFTAKHLVLQILHEAMREVAWSRFAPNAVFRAWCRLGDAAYGGPRP